jgi:ATP-dependent 26S proteasome regulatory subunit
VNVIPISASDFISMSVERDIRYDLIARLCPNATGAELKSVATEASSPSAMLIKADRFIGWDVCDPISAKGGD